MKLKSILNNFKSKFTKQTQLNDLVTASEAWFESEDFEELVQAYKDAEKNFKFGNVD